MKAVDELSALDANSAISTMLIDYGRLRKELFAKP
jgi:hypothetical protein